MKWGDTILGAEDGADNPDGDISRQGPLLLDPRHGERAGRIRRRAWEGVGGARR